MRLYAPDVALTEAAVGSGVTGVLLVTAGARLRSGARQTGVATATGRPLRVVAAAPVASLVAACDLPAAVLSLPEPPPTLAPEARAGLAATGLGNPVTAVLIAYRSFDTMLEKIVLLLALVGVWSVAADRRLGQARPRPSAAWRPMARWSCSPRCSRRSGSWSASIFSGSGRTSPAAPSRAAPCWRRCG